jgi:hypothetical protein
MNRLIDNTTEWLSEASFQNIHTIAWDFFNEWKHCRCGSLLLPTSKAGTHGSHESLALTHRDTLRSSHVSLDE